MYYASCYQMLATCSNIFFYFLGYFLRSASQNSNSGKYAFTKIFWNLRTNFNDICVERFFAIKVGIFMVGLSIFASTNSPLPGTGVIRSDCDNLLTEVCLTSLKLGKHLRSISHTYIWLKVHGRIASADKIEYQKLWVIISGFQKTNLNTNFNIYAKLCKCLNINMINELESGVRAYIFYGNETFKC